MSDRYNTPIIIIVGCLLVFAFYYFFKRNNVVKNEGTLNMKGGSENTKDDNMSYTNDESNSSNYDVEDDSLDIISRRAKGLDGNYFQQQGTPRENSYRAKKQDLSGVDDAYEIEDMTKKYTDQYVPIDASDGNNIGKTTSNNKNERNDKYGKINGAVDFDNYKGNLDNKHDVDKLLPAQVEQDWFETINPTNVKNSNLINIYRPIGVNTISSSHKYACRDIRGIADAVCPKFTVSPFLQSSVPPDRSYKSLC